MNLLAREFRKKWVGNCRTFRVRSTSHTFFQSLSATPPAHEAGLPRYDSVVVRTRDVPCQWSSSLPWSKTSGHFPSERNRPLDSLKAGHLLMLTDEIWRNSTENVESSFCKQVCKTSWWSWRIMKSLSCQQWALKQECFISQVPRACRYTSTKMVEKVCSFCYCYLLLKFSTRVFQGILNTYPAQILVSENNKLRTDTCLSEYWGCQRLSSWNSNLPSLFFHDRYFQVTLIDHKPIGRHVNE